ncbi:unnamed protein product [Lathyrus sativus]|nr:unnamed protein product [Lathyrus sativus]
MFLCVYLSINSQDVVLKYALKMGTRLSSAFWPSYGVTALFGYGFGFLLIIPAVAIGVSLPFIIGSIFHHKIEG